MKNTNQALSFRELLILRFALGVFFLLWASLPSNSLADYTAEEEGEIIECNQNREYVNSLLNLQDVTRGTSDEEEKSSGTLLKILKNRDQARINASRLSKNAEEIENELNYCDTRCVDLQAINPNDPGQCFEPNREAKVLEIIEERKEQSLEAFKTADTLEATFQALCSKDPQECIKASKNASVKPPTADELSTFQKLSRKIKAANYRQKNGKKAPSLWDDGIASVIKEGDEIFNKIKGETNVKQNPVGVDGGTSPGLSQIRADIDNLNKIAATNKSTKDSSESKDEVTAASKFELGDKSKDLLATAAVVKGQYDAKKESERNRAANDALRAASLAEAAQSEALNAGLRIDPKDLKDLALNRTGDGLTGIGNGGNNLNPLANSRTVASVNPAAQGRPGSPATTPGANGSTGAPAASAKASLGGSGSGGSSGGARSSRSSGGSGGSDFDRYTQDRGFFAAAKKALGFGPKKKSLKNGERRRKAEASAAAAEGQKVSDPATAAIGKHWNKVLRRVEEGPNRGVASLSGNARGITSRDRSIFGSVCSRYSAFRIDTGLKIGKSVCPSGE